MKAKEFAMKALAAIAIGIASIVTAQTTTFDQAPHIHTTLNHFTVIDPGEPITMFALADHGSFELQRSSDKLFLEPLRENVSTNLFIWTATRQLIYEIDPAGELSRMDMLVRIPPPDRPSKQSAGPAGTTEQDIQRLSARVLNDAFVRTESITLDDRKPHPGEITVRIEEVLRSKDQILLRFSLSNQSKDPFRVTSPDVFQPHPTQAATSLMSLRDHQLNQQTSAGFKAMKGSPIDVIHAEVLNPEVQPGQTTTGVITFHGDDHDQPQLYEMDFGSFQNQVLIAEVVL
jgi:hypothetical protein